MKAVFLIVFCTSAFLTAQSTILLYPEGIPCENELEEAEDERANIGRFISSVHEPLLEHYAPVPQIATGGAVMVIPGGGYAIAAWGHEGADIAQRLVVEGLHVFVLKYRLPKNESADCRSKVALADARRGVQTIRMLADSLSIGHNKVAVLGFSAGGHLAASAAVHFIRADSSVSPTAGAYSSRPDLSIPVYPVTIMEASEAAHQGSIENLLGPKPWDEALLNYFNLPAQVHPKVPPTFLVHAGDDKVVPVENSLRYYTALQQAGVPAELHVYAEGGHGFGSGRQTDLPAREWMNTLLIWLRGYGFVR